MSGLLSVRSLAASAAALTAGALFQAVAGFLAQLVLMRLLVPEDFGRFAVVLAGCSLVQTLLSLRLNVLIIRVPDAELTETRRTLIRAALVWDTLLSALVTLAWLGAGGLLGPYALMLVGSLALAQWTGQSTAFYERGMPYGRIALVETGSQMAGHAVAVALVLAGGGALALYVREVVVALARLGAFARLGALEAPCWRLPRLADIRTLIAETRAFWAEAVADSGFARVVVLATGAITGLHGTGLFTQGQRLAMVPHQLLSPVVSRLSANAFSRAVDPHQRRRLLTALVGGTLAALSVAATLAVLLADPVVPFLFGDHWAGVVDILRALAGMIVFLSAFEVLRAYAFALKQVWMVMAARAGQFAAFLAGVALAREAADPGVALAWSLSASYAAAFLILVGLLALVRPGRSLLSQGSP